MKRKKKERERETNNTHVLCPSFIKQNERNSTNEKDRTREKQNNRRGRDEKKKKTEERRKKKYVKTRHLSGSKNRHESVCCSFSSITIF